MTPAKKSKAALEKEKELDAYVDWGLSIDFITTISNCCFCKGVRTGVTGKE